MSKIIQSHHEVCGPTLFWKGSGWTTHLVDAKRVAPWDEKKALIAAEADQYGRGAEFGPAELVETRSLHPIYR